MPFGMSRPDLLLLVQPMEGQEGEGWRGVPTLSCVTAETSNLHQQTKESGFHTVYVPFCPVLKWRPSFHLLKLSFCLFLHVNFNELEVSDYLQRYISNTNTLPEKKAAPINIGILLSFRRLLKSPIFTNLTCDL